MCVKHRYGWPRRHDEQVPHGGSQLAMTWSPGARSLTPSPPAIAGRKVGMAHSRGAHFDQHLAGAWPDDLHVVPDVQLGVTDRMEHRSAHGPPPISAESSCDPVKSRTGYSQRRKTLRPLARCADGTAQWGVAATDRDIELSGGGRTAVHRRGDIVVRDTGPWTPAVHALLRHLEAVGFAAAPRLVGDGIDEDGRELLTFIEGDFTQPGP